MKAKNRKTQPEFPERRRCHTNSLRSALTPAPSTRPTHLTVCAHKSVRASFHSSVFMSVMLLILLRDFRVSMFVCVCVCVCMLLAAVKNKAGSQTGADLLIPSSRWTGGRQSFERIVRPSVRRQHHLLKTRQGMPASFEQGCRCRLVR